jgi:hypothetical protein
MGSYNHIKVFFLWSALLVWMHPNAAWAEIKLHGFGDIVATKSNTAYPFNGLSNRGKALSLDAESRMGLNLSSELSEQLDFASQIVARGAGGGSYNLQADWLFLSYRPWEDFTFKVGRQLLPAFLFSEQIDVGYTYIWTRTPYEIYGSFPTKAFNGLSVIYTKLLGEAQFSAQLIAGGGELVLLGLSPTNGFPSTTPLVVNNLKGITFNFNSGPWKTHLHYNNTNHSKFYSAATLPAADLHLFQLYTAGVSYDDKRILAISEALRILANNEIISSTTAASLTFGYHVNSRLTPYISGSWKDSISSSIYGHPSVLVQTPTTLLTSSYAYTGGVNYRAGLSTVLKTEYMKTGLRFVNNTLNYRVSTITTSVDFVF